MGGNEVVALLYELENCNDVSEGNEFHAKSESLNAVNGEVNVDPPVNNSNTHVSAAQHDASSERVEDEKMGSDDTFEYARRETNSESSKVDHDKRRTTFNASDKPYLCEECGKSYKTNDNLKRHIKEAHKNPKVQCSVCCNKFAEGRTYEQHMLKQHGQDIKDHSPPSKKVSTEHKCDECEKGYSCKKNLNRHIKEAHRTEKVACEICFKFYP